MIEKIKSWFAKPKTSQVESYEQSGMTIIKSHPPNWKQILDSGMKPTETVAITYGNKIYIPSGNPLSEDLMVHEKVHAKRQGENPDGWWDDYLDNSEFRLNEEVEAYRQQYKFICRIQKDRNIRAKVLMTLASHLAGPIYGNLVSQQEARKLIEK